MSAPTLSVLLDFETQLDAAIATGIEQFTYQELSLKVFTLQTTDELPENRIEVTVSTQGAAGPQGMAQQFGRSAAAYSGRVEVMLITRRQTFPNVGLARGLIRQALDPQGETFSQISASLDYLDIMDMTPAETSRGTSEDAEKKQDLNMLAYTIIFGVKPGAWPAT